MGEAPLWALAPALLSLHYPASRGKVMGFYNAMLHIGLTLGPLFGIAALKFSSHISGDAPFLFYSGACLVSALIVALTVDDVCDTGVVPASGAGMGRVVELLGDSRLFATLIGIALYGAGYGLFITTIPAYLLRKAGESQIFVQIFFACFYLAISFSQLLAGPMSDRWGRERFMISGLALSALFLALFPLFSGASALAALTMAGLGLGFFYLSSMAYLNAAAPPSLKGSVSGAYFLFWGVGYFAGPPLAGYLNSAFAPDGGFYSYCALMFAETLLLTRLLRRPDANRACDDV